MKLPTYFISHGGGPWPSVPDMRRVHQGLEQSLQDIPRQLGVTPKAVLMISAHWEDTGFSVSSGAQPGMIYDYGGFPANTYSVRYPAPGSPELAQRVLGLLQDAGLPTRLDAARGYDHGTFVPLAVMYPEAQVPVVQVSVQHGYAPAIHLALGRALAPLRDEGVLIIGSGLSYHNMRAMGPAGKGASAVFDAWLQDAVVQASPTERQAQLANWSAAPGARQSHPQEDHLIPLMVAAGAAEHEAASCVYHESNFFGGLTVSSFQFGQIGGQIGG
jgi:aromatic ring-opening dioxygenase catalytic subunit (LigB family)